MGSDGRVKVLGELDMYLAIDTSNNYNQPITTKAVEMNNASIKFRSI